MPDSYFKEIQKIESISNEAYSKLEEFAALLEKWNKKINLVSGLTGYDEIWTRHIIDSAQLKKYIKDDIKTIIDLGSGGGLPGIIIAILCPGVQVNLVESDSRKCAFLAECSSKMGLGNIKIHNCRIEDLEVFESDIITARALAPLDQLINYAQHFIKKSKFALFQKGENAIKEINEALENWSFSYKILDGMNEKSFIIKISDLKQEV